VHWWFYISEPTIWAAIGARWPETVTGPDPTRGAISACGLICPDRSLSQRPATSRWDAPKNFSIFPTASIAGYMGRQTARGAQA
jgi:hypothetical protein